MACGPGRVPFGATVGQTYHILAFDDTPGAGNGGTLRFFLAEAPPPPEVHLAVDPTGRVNARTGVATVTGTFSCSGAPAAFINVTLSQHVGRIVTIRGFGFAEVTPCDRAAHAWSVDVRPDSGKFAGGPASVAANIFACGITGSLIVRTTWSDPQHR